MTIIFFHNLLIIKKILVLFTLLGVFCNANLAQNADIFDSTALKKTIILDSTARLFTQRFPNGRRLAAESIAASDYERFADALLLQMERHGYPFAEISLQNIDLTKDTIAQLHVEPNAAVAFDSVIVSGNLKLSQHFLRPYLGWRKRKPYDESVAAQVAKRIEALPYAQTSREAGIEFVGERAYLYLFLDKQRVNQFDGYIGLVPISATTGGVMVTGELNLSLRNIFTMGESLDLRWQAPERYSQFLSVSADFPYLFATPIGISGQFVLDKKDTTYLNMNYLAALQYSFRGTNSLQAYFNYHTSSILSRANEPMPAADDSTSCNFRKSMYGIRLNGQQLDDIRSPRRGITGALDIAIGRRTLLKSAQDVTSGHEGSDLQSTSYRMTGNVTGFVPIAKRWGWVGGLQAGTLMTRKNVYNELFRIGGTRTLQGFDEFSIYASTYVIAATEFRFWMAPQSYLNAFFNAGWYERRLSEGLASDFPFGFGIGTTIHTRAGNLYISYALGQQKNSPISFKTGKIHLGIDVRF